MEISQSESTDKINTDKYKQMHMDNLAGNSEGLA